MICDNCKKLETCTAEDSEKCEALKKELNLGYDDFSQPPVDECFKGGEKLTVIDPKIGAKPLLTENVRAVLRCLPHGMTRAETAKELGITRDNLKHILLRWRAKNTTLEPSGKSERHWLPLEPLCALCPQKSNCTAPCERVRDSKRKIKPEWAPSPFSNLSIYIHENELRVYDSDTGMDKPLLTPKEKEFLDALAQGLTSDGIVEKLKISRSTLRTYKQTLTNKAGHLGPVIEEE